MEIASARRPPWRPPVVIATVALALAAGAVGGCPRRPRGPAVNPDAGAAKVATAALAGRVVDRRDRPVPEARVLAFATDGSAGPAETATDLEGRFRVEHLGRGPHRLLVEAAGFPTAEALPTAPASDLLVKMEGEGRSIVGRVEAAGAPVAGARVRLAPDDGGPIRETVSRGGGGFAFGGLGEGLYAVRAAAAGKASETRRAIEARDTGPTHAGTGDGGSAGVAGALVLELRPGANVAGRVIDDAGAGQAGVEVRLELAGETLGADPLPTLVPTGADGRFVAGPVPPGAYRLTASRPGYILRRAPRVGVDPAAAAPPPEATLELVRGAWMGGRVRDGHGAAAAGARVRCVASALDDLTVQTGPLPLAAEAAALPSGAGRALGSTRAALADRDGRFAIADLIPGRYHLEIAHPGAEPFRSDEILVAPGERRDVGTLGLRAGVAAAGRVVDEMGNGIEGARVLVSGAGATVAPAGLFAVTDAGGRFSVTLPAGAYRLAASASGRGGAQAPLEIGVGAAPAPVELRLMRAEATLEGLVRDTGGRPLVRARLSVLAGDAAGAAVGSGSTDVGGHFRIPSLPAGELRIQIEHPDYPPHGEAVAAGRYAAITVPFPGGIAGEIRARVTGAAVTRGRLEAIGPGGARSATDLRKTASFRLMRLRPGRWRLTVTAPGFRPAEQELDVAAGVTLGEPSVRDLRVELDPS